MTAALVVSVAAAGCGSASLPNGTGIDGIVTVTTHGPLPTSQPVTKPIPNATVTVMNAGTGDTVGWGVTDAAGDYKVDAPPGVYVVVPPTVVGDGVAPPNETVTVTAGSYAVDNIGFSIDYP